MLIQYAGWDLTCDTCGRSEHVEIRVPFGAETPKAFDGTGRACLNQLKLEWQLMLGVLYCGECADVLRASMKVARESIEWRGTLLTTPQEIEAFYLKNTYGPVVAVRTKSGNRTLAGCASEALALLAE